MMTLCIVVLDVRKLSGIVESRHVPVQVTSPLVYGGIPAADVS